MDLSLTIRPSLSRLTFVFFGLALAVFAWGLQYKVSLYYPTHSTYRQLPEAKLLSKNEQSTAPKSHLTASAKAPGKIAPGGSFALLIFGLLLGLLTISGGSQTEPGLERPWVARLCASLNAFFFRPPPSHLRSV